MKKITINLGLMIGVCYIISLTINIIQSKYQFNDVSFTYSLGHALLPFSIVIITASIITAIVWLFKKKLWEDLIPFMWIALTFIEITIIYGLSKIPNNEKPENLSQYENLSKTNSLANVKDQAGISIVDSLMDIKHLHSILMNKWNGFNVPFEQFAKDMQEEANQHKLYTNLHKEWSWFNIPYNEFSSKISESMEREGIHNYKKEVVALTKELEINPGNAEAYHKRGIAKCNLQDSRGAIADYTQALKINPKNPEIYKDRAFSRLKLSEYTGSIADYTKAIAIDPKSSEAYYWRGVAKLNLDMKESACLDFSRAGELGHKDAYSTIAKYCK